MLKLNHKNLDVYKGILQLVQEVYLLTSKFPEQEKFGLTLQIKRAVVSVISNLAEGSSRSSEKDRKRFLEISRSSLVEVDTQIEISAMLGFVFPEQLQRFHQLILKVFILLSTMINKLKN